MDVCVRMRARARVCEWLRTHLEGDIWDLAGDSDLGGDPPYAVSLI